MKIDDEKKWKKEFLTLKEKEKFLRGLTEDKWKRDIYSCDKEFNKLCKNFVLDPSPYMTQCELSNEDSEIELAAKIFLSDRFFVESEVWGDMASRSINSEAHFLFFLVGRHKELFNGEK